MLPLKTNENPQLSEKRFVDASHIADLFLATKAFARFGRDFRVNFRNSLFSRYLSIESDDEIIPSEKTRALLKSEIMPRLESGLPWHGCLEFIAKGRPITTPVGMCFSEYDENSQLLGYGFLFQPIPKTNLSSPVEYTLLHHPSPEVQGDEAFAIEERMRYVGDLGADGFWDWDLVNNTEYMSPSFKALFGYEDHELPNLPESWQKLIFPEDRKKAEKAFINHIENDAPYHIDVRYRHKDGSTVHVLCRGVALKDENGQFVRMVGTHTDITKLKETEAELKRVNEQLENLIKERTEQLEDSKISFRKMAESVPVSVWRCDAEGSNDYLSPKWAEYTGQTQDQMEGNGWLNAIHEKDRERVLARWKHSVETGIPMETEYRLRSKDGEYRWFVAQALASFDHEGKVEAWFGASKDVHEERMQAQELLRYTQELERSNNDLEQFAHIASHDLQEPLRMVVSFSDILVSDYRENLDEKGIEYLGYVAEGGKRMQALINDVLKFSRIATDNIEAEVVNANDSIDSILSEQRAVIAETGATVEVTEIPEVICNREQFKQLCRNLITNAFKFHSEKAPILRIRAEQDEVSLSIFFEDNGIGIKRGHQARIFRMFQRLNSRDKYSGNGIGLAIVRKIVDANGWDIKVSSKPGEGSTFRVVIPNSRLGGQE